MIIDFRKEHEVEGNKYSAVEIKLEDLSGKDLMDLQKDWRRISTSKNKNTESKSLITLALNTDFIVFVCAKFSQKPLEFFTSLPAKDFMAVTGEVQNFLLDTD